MEFEKSCGGRVLLEKKTGKNENERKKPVWKNRQNYDNREKACAIRQAKNEETGKSLVIETGKTVNIPKLPVYGARQNCENSKRACIWSKAKL